MTDPSDHQMTAEADSDETLGRDLTQLMGVIVIATGLVLVVVQSLAIVPGATISDSTLRLLLLAGLVLLSGRESLRAIAKRFA